MSVSEFYPECSICLEPFEPPCYQCHNGHLICKSCIKQVSTCPTRSCRVGISSPYIRNILLDKFVEGKIFRCKHPGCELQFTVVELRQHIRECEFRPRQYCKVLGIKDCLDSIGLKSVFKHMQSFHQFGVLENSQVEVKYNFAKVLLTTEMEPVILFAFKKLFAVRFIVGPNTVSWFISTNSSEEELSRFRIKLQLSNYKGPYVEEFKGHPGNDSPTFELPRSYFFDKYVTASDMGNQELCSTLMTTLYAVYAEDDVLAINLGTWVKVSLEDLQAEAVTPMQTMNNRVQTFQLKEKFQQELCGLTPG